MLYRVSFFNTYQVLSSERWSMNICTSVYKVVTLTDNMPIWLPSWGASAAWSAVVITDIRLIWIFLTYNWGTRVNHAPSQHLDKPLHEKKSWGWKRKGPALYRESGILRSLIIRPVIYISLSFDNPFHSSQIACESPIICILDFSLEGLSCPNDRLRIGTKPRRRLQGGAW